MWVIPDSELACFALLNKYDNSFTLSSLVWRQHKLQIPLNVAFPFFVRNLCSHRITNVFSPFNFRSCKICTSKSHTCEISQNAIRVFFQYYLGSILKLQTQSKWNLTKITRESITTLINAYYFFTKKFYHIIIWVTYNATQTSTYREGNIYFVHIELHTRRNFVNYSPKMPCTIQFANKLK